MNIQSYIALILTANYWRFRRQEEDHETSAFWVKMLYGLLFPMWGGMGYHLLFQTVAALQPFRARAASGQAAWFLFLTVVGYWGLHRFMGVRPEIYTDYLTPEGYRMGNVYGLLLLAASAVGFSAAMLKLGKM